MKKTTDRETLLQLIASLTLCDHMGDVANDVDIVLKRLGISFEWDELSEVGDKLGEMGITTLYGTSIGGRDSE
jgi:hypothetical protein